MTDTLRLTYAQDLDREISDMIKKRDSLGKIKVDIINHQLQDTLQCSYRYKSYRVNGAQIL